MNPVLLAHAVVLILNLTLGLVVFWTNPRRTANQLFLVLALVAGTWIGALVVAFLTVDLRMTTKCVRVATLVCCWAPLVFNYMRLSIVNRSDTLLQVVRRSPVWLILNLATAYLCTTQFFLKTVIPPPAGAMPYVIAEPVYGPGLRLYALFWIGCLVTLVYRFRQDLRRAAGISRTELQFILLGGVTGLVMGFIPGVLMPLITRSSQSVLFAAPLAIIFLVGITAYGIATRRIMDVAYVLRLATAYSLVTAYLLAVYLAVFLPARFLLEQFHAEMPNLPHVLAALVVAFSMAPAHGRMQQVAARLFVHGAALDMGRALRSADQLLRSISTVDDLLAQFGRLLAGSVGTDRVVILLAEDGHFVQRYPSAGEDGRVTLRRGDALPSVLLADAGAPLVADVVRRLNPTAQVANACRQLDTAQASAAVGMLSKEGLDGIILLGPRLSGRIYGSPEQQDLQVLANQLAVALNNARLYTQLQDSKLYNDVLLDSLVSGVIAANSEGRVTVFNREAQRITRLRAEDVVGRPLTDLPRPLAETLQTALREGAGVRDVELTLVPGPEEETPLRAGSALFTGHAGQVLGAFLVMNDMTALAKLELQVRRTDRLASLGTLSAGMAHEIKNPLVTIKTFTQLLPERYDDPDFRETFFSLIGTEVKRIDSIVNQLLRFSRPAKPDLRPTSLHEVLDALLQLVAQQLRQKNIALRRDLGATDDWIQADANQLNQAFLNFLLNAIDAMAGRTGTLTVATANLAPPQGASGEGERPPDGRRIRVSLQDTGGGIQPDHIPHIFDPFFTTKSHGTGLGLSVAHGIIEDHHGAIDVRSELGVGTTFEVVFPVVAKEGIP